MDPEARWRRAWEYAQTGNLVAAIAEYEAIIALDPRQPRAWLALAIIDQRRGYFRSVVKYARMAANAMYESADWRSLADIATLLGALGESRLTVRAIIQADWSDPEVLGNADRLATCLGRVDHHADALRLLDHALSRLAVTPALSFIRATTLRHLGRAQEATLEYQRCLTLAPDYSAAMLMLASHDPRADAEGQIARIRQALAQCPADAPSRPMLHYAHFHHLDKTEDSAAAWEALIQGATSKRRLIRYDPSREQARDNAIMALCSSSFVSASHTASTDHVPIFIVGLPRTGTTVLERILGNHSQVASAGELDDFHWQMSWQADINSAELASPALIEASTSLDFASIGRGYLQRTTWRAAGKRFLIDKLPQNFIHAGLIHKALPQARIICLLRNPMDSVFSNLKELFAGSIYPYSYAPLDIAAHYLRFREMLRYWDEVMPGVILAVRYEELVREPARIARQVMDHCGLTFEPDCVDLLRNSSPSATASSSQVREPLHARSIGAWRRYSGPLAEAHAFLKAKLPPGEFAGG